MPYLQGRTYVRCLKIMLVQKLLEIHSTESLTSVPGITQTRAMKLLLLSSQHLLDQPLGRWWWIITSDLETFTPSLCFHRRDHCKCKVCCRTRGVARCLFRLLAASCRILGCGDQPVVGSLEMPGPGLHEGQDQAREGQS